MKPTQVGLRLTAARLAVGFDVRMHLADDLEIDRSALTKYELGQRLLPDYIAVRFCDRYGITLDWLYRGRPDGIEQPLRSEILRRFDTLRPRS